MTTAGDADRFAAAHQALKADGSVQFALSAPPPEPKTPDWLAAVLEWLGDLLEPVARFLGWIGSFMPDAPVARLLLWTIIAAAALAIAWAVYQRLRTGEWRLPSFGGSSELPVADEELWHPEEAPAQRWLEEAEALAKQGKYAEAIHHLLFRSIEDIGKRRPGLVRPALTSREIATSEGLPERARNLFARMVGLVEHSFFAGRGVGEDDWAAARAAYSDFAVGRTWRS